MSIGFNGGSGAVFVRPRRPKKRPKRRWSKVSELMMKLWEKKQFQQINQLRLSRLSHRWIDLVSVWVDYVLEK